MAAFSDLFTPGDMRPATEAQRRFAQRIAAAAGFDAYEASLVLVPDAAALLARKGIEKKLLIAAREPAPSWVADFGGEAAATDLESVAVMLKVCPLTHENALALRRHFPYTAPRCFGTRTAAGMGDRLGLGTPGHVRAARGTGLVPFLAQQSIREMTRTGRSAAEVMDDASWGVFQEGWVSGFGSDADHLKTTADIDTCAAAGFTMFTVDPGDHVDNSADKASGADLARKFDAVDWKGLESSAAELRKAYLAGPLALEGGTAIKASEEQLLRAAVKYGAAVAHTARMYRHLAGTMGSQPFELEMSVDETETPTSTFEHYFVARELKRLGVKWVSLAPRFVGEFEKGIDYKGDVAVFEKSFAEHVAVMRTFGPYKISIHSGSDKFTIYPVMARLAGPYVHLKTAGTSYLEALRVIAERDPALFREILDFAFARYEEDKKSYHVSAQLANVPHSTSLNDGRLSTVLDINDGRQLLHVTFGSVLTTRRDGGYLFRNRLLTALRENEERYYEVLQSHLGRHIEPFVHK